MARDKNSKSKLNPKLVSLSLALVFGVAYIICAFLFALIPAGMMYATSSLFHGVNIMSIARTNMMLGNILFGLIEVMVIGLFVGWLFAKVYNALLEKER